MQDLRLAVRALGRAPVYATAAILSLALGIGANTAMFSLIDQLLLRMLPVERPQDLVFLYHPGPLEGTSSTDEPGGASFSYPVFRALQAQQTVLTGLAGSRSARASLSDRGQGSTGTVHRVSGNYFEVLGVHPALGRLLTEDDDRAPGAGSVAVLSHRYWMSRWAGDVSVLNRSLTVNGHPMTIVGVAQEGFDQERPGGASVDAFVPITMNREISPGWNGFEDRKEHWVTLAGRLRPGISREVAETAVNVAYRAQLEEDLTRQGRRDQQFLTRYRAKRIVLKPGHHGRGTQREQARTPLLVLTAMTALVLLVACANLVNLQLARGLARVREIALRTAIGASRRRLVRCLLAESLVLASVGGLLGLWIGHAMLRGLGAAAADYGLAISSSVLDGRLLACSLVLTLGTAVLFGLYPALQSSRPDVVTALKAQPPGAARAGSLRHALVATQVGASLLLLIAAGLFGRTFVKLTRVELGIVPDHLVTFSVEPRLSGYSDARAAAFYRDLADRLATTPGVKLVSAARVPAVAGSMSTTNVTVEGFAAPNDEDWESAHNAVGPGYFRTMGMPLLAGREFTAQDDAGAGPVAVVNEAFARHFLSGRDALGRRFREGRGKGELDVEIVGVVKDARYSSPREVPPPTYYRPYRQGVQQAILHFYVRTAVDAEAIAPAIRREVADLDPSVPIRELKTMRRQIEQNVGAERLLSVLTGGFAGLAIVLAGIGLYGVLAYDVARRTREIGIRIALGASRREVRLLVLRQVGLMLGFGAVGGVAAAAAAGRLVEANLFDVSAWDPLVYGSALALVAVLGLLSAYLPSRRASRVDPMVALRQE